MATGTSGQVVIKNTADLEPGIDIIEGANQQSGFGGAQGVPPLRVFGPDAKTVLFQVGTLGGVNSAGPSYTVVTKTTNYIAVGSDGVILADATSGAITITLPAANISTPFGKTITVIKKDTSANAVTVQRAGSDTLLGGTITSVNLQVQDARINLVSDGVSIWYAEPQAFNAGSNQLKTVATTYTVTISDYKILGNATSAGFTITLPAANSVPPGWQVSLEKSDSSGNAVTVSRAGADTIEGATTVSLSAQFNGVRLTSDGVSVWYKAL